MLLSFLSGEQRQLPLLVIAAWQVYDKCLPCVTGETLSDSVLLLQIEADVCLFVLTQTLDGKAWANSTLITVGCFNVCAGGTVLLRLFEQPQSGSKYRISSL